MRVHRTASRHSLEIRTTGVRANGKERVMTEQHSTETRRYKFDQIRAKELARGASEDEATRIASETVDKVLAQEAKDK